MTSKLVNGLIQMYSRHQTKQAFEDLHGLRDTKKDTLPIFKYPISIVNIVYLCMIARCLCP